MKRYFFLCILLTTSLFAKHSICETEKIFIVSTKSYTYKELLLNLKDEINYNSFTIVHKLNLEKSTNTVANALNKEEILEKGKNILFCKTSLTLNMIEENIHNINYCPLSISIYKKKKEALTYISFKKYHSYNKKDKIAKQINETVKKLILSSFD